MARMSLDQYEANALRGAKDEAHANAIRRHFASIRRMKAAQAKASPDRMSAYLARHGKVAR